MTTSTMPGPPVARLLATLPDAHQSGDGWSARCPAHADQRASLSITAGDDGRALLHCHAGCATADVLKAIGLTTKDLFPLPAENGHAANGRGRIVAEYSYLDESGALLYQAVRFEPKDFRQRRPKDGGGWTWNTKDCRKVLYRLPELPPAPITETVFLPEGEKDVDSLRKLGLIATCNVGGAGKWRDEYNEHLRGRSVVIIADADESGRKHAQQVGGALQGVAAEVKIVEMPRGAKDASDWIAAGGTTSELRQIVDSAGTWNGPAPKPKRERARKPAPQITPDSLDLRSASARTDVANARRMIEAHRDKLRWCDPWGKWLVWDGRRWAIDHERCAESLAKEVATVIWAEIAKLVPVVGADVAVELVRFGHATASARGIGNMLALARSEAGIPILPDALDAQAWLLNCRDGTIDLKTGKLLPHRRDDNITKIVPHDHMQGPEAECPLWDDFLDKIFGGNRGMVGFVQRLFGSALVGEVIEHVLPILWGKGSNGKTVLIETIRHVLGDDYACKAASDLLLAKRNDSHPTERADLHGKRLVICAETDENRRLAEGLVKELTGGDTIKARRMREDFWSFKPSHTAVLTTNHKPEVRGTDHGIWRRLRLVPFVVTFWDRGKGESGPPELEADKHLAAKLQAEAAGILRWLVEGCLAWQRGGLDEPAEVTAATAEYRSAMDVLAAFIGDHCIIDPGVRVKAGDLYAAYCKWCETNGETAKGSRTFGEAVAEKFERKISNGKWYHGIGLAEQVGTVE